MLSSFIGFISRVISLVSFLMFIFTMFFLFFEFARFLVSVSCKHVFFSFCCRNVPFLWQKHDHVAFGGGPCRHMHVCHAGVFYDIFLICVLEGFERVRCSNYMQTCNVEIQAILSLQKEMNLACFVPFVSVKKVITFLEINQFQAALRGNLCIDHICCFFDVFLRKRTLQLESTWQHWSIF